MAMTTLSAPVRAANPLRRIMTALEPWYDWGETYVSRIDTAEEGPGRFFELQWFGLNLTVFMGRTPKREG